MDKPENCPDEMLVNTNGSTLSYKNFEILLYPCCCYCYLKTLGEKKFKSVQLPSVHIPVFPGVLLPVLCTIFFPNHWLLSHIAIVEVMDSSERGINPVAMTIVNPQEEFWASNQRPCVLRSCLLSTELWGFTNVIGKG